MTSRCANYLGLILKCQRLGERDLLVTLVTREQGRLLAKAQGVRRLQSTKRATLEAGNLAHVQLVTTKGWPLLTQAQLVADARAVRTNLAAVRKLLLFLEILDRLLVSEELEPELFRRLLYLRELIVQGVSHRLIREQFAQVLAALGYQTPADTPTSIASQVAAILDDQLHTFDYLSIKM